MLHVSGQIQLQLGSYIHAHANETHPPADLQDLIPTLAGVVTYYMYIPAKVGIKSCRCAREYFICTCVWLHRYVRANSHRLVDYSYIAQYS